jgi:hypothetical protein
LEIFEEQTNKSDISIPTNHVIFLQLIRDKNNINYQSFCIPVHHKLSGLKPPWARGSLYQGSQLHISKTDLFLCEFPDKIFDVKTPLSNWLKP